MTESMLDQSVGPLDILETIEHGVDVLIKQAIVTRDDTNLRTQVRGIRVAVQVHGLFLARLLYKWQENCTLFGIEPDDWVDYVFAATGLSVQTIRKYTNVWRIVFENPNVPDEVKLELAGKPMQGLLLLPAAIQENLLSEEDWDDLADAHDPRTMRDVVRKVRGEATSSGTAVRLVLMRDGVLMAWRGEECEPVGYLKRTQELDIIGIAVERIIRASGIVEE